MDVSNLIIVVLAVTQFIKTAALRAFKVEIGGKAAVVVSALAAAGVVFYKAIETNAVLGLGLVPVLIQVIIGANMGYSLIKVARNK